MSNKTKGWLLLVPLIMIITLLFYSVLGWYGIFVLPAGFAITMWIKASLDLMGKDD